MPAFDSLVARPRTILIGVLATALCVGVSTAWAGEPQAKKPFVFGVMADIQYADKDTQGRRHYRPALKKLEECVVDLNKRNPTFVVQLGDIIDGHLGNVEKSTEDLDAVLRVFNRLKMPKYHVIGNHCIYAGRKNLQKKLGLKRFYYDFTVPEAKGWRFVVLDGNDAGYSVIGEKQIEWFCSTLARAADNDERVICFCHFPLLRRATDNFRLAKPRSLLRMMEDAGCVVAWFAGHLHAGGYVLHNGVHHVTFKGMVDAPVKNAYALVELYPNRIHIIGLGKEPSRDLPMTTRPSKSNAPGTPPGKAKLNQKKHASSSSAA